MNFIAFARYGEDASTPSLWKCSSNVIPCNSGKSNVIGGVLSVFFPSRSWRRKWSLDNSTSSGGGGGLLCGNIWECT